MRTAQLQAKAGRNKAIEEVTEDQVGYGVNIDNNLINEKPRKNGFLQL